MRYRLCVLMVWSAAYVGGLATAHLRLPSASDYRSGAVEALRAGRTETAELLLRRALARGADDTADRLLLSTLARNRSEWATAAAVLQSIPDTDPDAVTVRVAEGDAWLRWNRAALADDAWRRASAIDPSDLLPLRRRLYLAALQLRRSLWAELLWTLYDRGETKLPEMLQLMVADQLVWQTPDVIDELGRYCAADPHDAHSHRALATYLVRAGRIEEAEHILEELDRRAPGNAATWSVRIDCALALADADVLRTLLEQAPAAERESFDDFQAAGALAFLERQYAASAAAYRQALARNPYDLERRYKLAQALRFAGEPHEAERHLRIAGRLARVKSLCSALYVDGWNLDHVRDLAGICEELLLIEEAIGWVRLALERAPEEGALRAKLDRLQRLPATSRRHPPAEEDLL